MLCMMKIVCKYLAQHAVAIVSAILHKNALKTIHRRQQEAKTLMALVSM